MAKASYNRASKQPYISPNQPSFPGFESPFTKHLNTSNRWFVLSHNIPWDTLVNVYKKQINNSLMGADGINPRVVIGSIIIKHMCDLSDRETVQQIQENIYMQYFLGCSSFSDKEPFDPSLFVEFRKRLGMEQINTINEKILHMSTKNEEPAVKEDPAVEAKPVVEVKEPPSPPLAVTEVAQVAQITPPETIVKPHEGKLIVDATACPQDIAYPTDLNLLSDFKEKAEEPGRYRIG